jgi:hypothetical protein
MKPEASAQLAMKRERSVVRQIHADKPAVRREAGIRLMKVMVRLGCMKLSLPVELAPQVSVVECFEAAQAAG